MATETTKNEKRPQTPQKKRKKKKGVPALLVIVLLIIAIAFGGLMGFTVARKTDNTREQLQEANARILELENTLTLIGFSTDDSNVEEFIFDDSEESDGMDELSGAFSDTFGDEADEWSDTTVLEGMLTAPAESVVVAEFDGGNLTSDEFIPEYNNQLTNQIFAGYNADDIADSLLQEVLSYMVSDKIIATKAAALGLDELTKEDLAAIDAEAKEIYDNTLEYYTAFVDDEALSEEEKLAAAAEFMESEEGSSLESITQELKDTWWVQKFYDYTVQGVTVSEEEIQAAYNDDLSEQKDIFSAYPEEYEYAAYTGETILYNLDGYRAVKHILIPFKNDTQAAAAMDLLDQIEQLNPETDSETIMEYQDQLNELYESLEVTAEEVLNKLQAGESFDSMIEAYGADEDMTAEPLRSMGYYVTNTTNLWSAEFIEGCMMLEQVGDISAPVRSASGIHIIQYFADITPGEVPLTQVHDSIKTAALEDKQFHHYDTQCQEWLASANVQYYPERLQ